MNRFQKFVASAGLAIIVAGVVFACSPHPAHAGEAMLTCHGVDAATRHMVAEGGLVGMTALVLGLALLLIP